MKKKILLLLCALVLGFPLAAQSTQQVPAMILYGTDGSKYVVELDAETIDYLEVLFSDASLSVDILESSLTGIRCITFAMVDRSEISSAIESVEDNDTTPIKGVEKILRDGQLIIRLQTQKGDIIEYDVRGNQMK